MVEPTTLLTYSIFVFYVIGQYINQMLIYQTGYLLKYDIKKTTTIHPYRGSTMLVNTFRATVFLGRGEQSVYFVKTYDSELSKDKEYLGYIPSSSIEDMFHGAILLDPILINREYVPQEYIPDYQI